MCSGSRGASPFISSAVIASLAVSSGVAIVSIERLADIDQSERSHAISIDHESSSWALIKEPPNII